MCIAFGGVNFIRVISVISMEVFVMAEPLASPAMHAFMY